MKILGRETEGNGQLETFSRRWKDNIETELKLTEAGGNEEGLVFMWC
jgi:hypothetical protein